MIRRQGRRSRGTGDESPEFRPLDVRFIAISFHRSFSFSDFNILVAFCAQITIAFTQTTVRTIKPKRLKLQSPNFCRMDRTVRHNSPLYQFNIRSNGQSSKCKNISKAVEWPASRARYWQLLVYLLLCYVTKTLKSLIKSTSSNNKNSALCIL